MSTLWCLMLSVVALIQGLANCYIHRAEDGRVSWQESSVYKVCGNDNFLKYKPRNSQICSENIQNSSVIVDENSRRERLRQELLPITLNIVYDAAFRSEFEELDDLEKFVRNVIFSTQLIFEQEELFQNIKLLLVVVNLKQATEEFLEDSSIDLKGYNFGKGPDVGMYADLHVFFSFKNLWRLNSTNNIIYDTLGLAQTGSFCCFPKQWRYLVLMVDSLDKAYTLAHEIGHSLGSHHDGYLDSKDCSSRSFIMSPSSGESKVKWSKCTAEALVSHLVRDYVYSCAFAPERLKFARPFKSNFDFTPAPDNPNRKLLPGQDFPIDAQCAKYFGASSSSMLTTDGKNFDDLFETCQWLYCIGGGGRFVSRLMHAPTGSDCLIKHTRAKGICVEGFCQQT